MPMTPNGIAHAQNSISGIFSALAQAPLLEKQAEMEAAMKGAQTYAYNQTGRLNEAKAGNEQFTLDNRRAMPGDITPEASATDMAKYLFRLSGDTNAANLSNALLKAQEYGAKRDVMAGTQKPETVGRAFAAVDGKPLYNAVGNTGYSMDNFTGAIDPGLKTLFGQKNASEVAENNAQAYSARAAGAKSYSGINVDNANIQKIKAETDKTKAGLPSIVGYDAQGNPILSTPPGAGGKPPAEYLKQADAYQNMDDAITGYDATLKGFNGVDWVNPQRRAELSNSYQNMLLQAKELYRLGVLNGPDKQILESIIKNPLDLRTVHLNKDTLLNQSQQMRKIVQNANKNLGKVYRQPVIPLNSEQAPSGAPAGGAPAGKTVVRTGTAPDGRRVVQYSDGTMDFQ